jgi:hypothetical protein
MLVAYAVAKFWMSARSKGGSFRWDIQSLELVWRPTLEGGLSERGSMNHVA